MIAWSVVFAHVVGGASLALGFVTRVAAAANALILFGAVIVSLTGHGGRNGSLLGRTSISSSRRSSSSRWPCLYGAVPGRCPLDHLIRIDAENGTRSRSDVEHRAFIEE